MEAFFQSYKDAHQKLRSALRFFTPDTLILSLFGIIEQYYDELEKNLCLVVGLPPKTF